VIILKLLKLSLFVFLVFLLTSCQSISSNNNPSNQIEINDSLSDYHDQNIDITIEKEVNQDYSAKMSPELLSTIDDLNDDEVVSVYVFLEQINYDEVSTRLLTLGIDESIYRDEVLFLEYIRQLYGNDAEIIAAERERYRTLRLQVIKQITLEANQVFIDSFDIDVNQIIYSSSYTTTLIIRVTVSTLKLITLNDNVIELSLYIETIPTNE
jgi:hypothetical protein